MKRFIKDWLINFALIILAATILPAILSGNWSAVKNIFEILGVTLIIRLLLLLTSRMSPKWPILQYIVEIGMVITVVLLSGLGLGWFTPKYMWIFIIAVLAVCIPAYWLDIARNQRDVEYINEKIRQRRGKNRRNQNYDN